MCVSTIECYSSFGQLLPRFEEIICKRTICCIYFNRKLLSCLSSRLVIIDRKRERITVFEHQEIASILLSVMGNVYGQLFRDSSIPGLSLIFATKSKTRKIILTIVFSILALLTVKDLYKIVIDYFHFPITVSVLVADSRVLPFPAVTICNLNAVHRGRFCFNKRIDKPSNVEQILCASLNDLLEVCKISDALDELVIEGEKICTNGKSRARKVSPVADIRPKTRPRPQFNNRRRPVTTIDNEVPSSSFNASDDSKNDTIVRGRGRQFRPRLRPTLRRGKREVELNIKTIISTFKAIQSGNLTGGIFESFTVSIISLILFIFSRVSY